jgi:hypothetical protein
MIGLLLLGFLGVLLCSSWILMRKVAQLSTQCQIIVAAPLFCIILLAPVQLGSGYSLASAWGPLVSAIVTCTACLLLLFLLWRKSRIAVCMILAVPILFSNVSLALAIELLMMANDASRVSTAEGRISPIASYRIVRDPGIWGGADEPYKYEIFENPRRLPFIWKEVVHDRVPCGKGLDGGGSLIGAGENDHVVVVSCRKPEPGFIPIQIPIG